MTSQFTDNQVELLWSWRWGSKRRGGTSVGYFDVQATRSHIISRSTYVGWKPFRCGGRMLLEFVSMRENTFQLIIHSLSKQVTIYSRNKQTDLFGLGRLRSLSQTQSRHLWLRRLIRVADLLSFSPLTMSLRRRTEFQGFGKHSSIFRLFASRASERYRVMRSGCRLAWRFTFSCSQRKDGAVKRAYELDVVVAQECLRSHGKHTILLVVPVTGNRIVADRRGLNCIDEEKPGFFQYKWYHIQQESEGANLRRGCDVHRNADRRLKFRD